MILHIIGRLILITTNVTKVKVPVCARPPRNSLCYRLQEWCGLDLFNLGPWISETLPQLPLLNIFPLWTPHFHGYSWWRRSFHRRNSLALCHKRMTQKGLTTQVDVINIWWRCGMAFPCRCWAALHIADVRSALRHVPLILRPRLAKSNEDSDRPFSFNGLFRILLDLAVTSHT